MLAQGHLGGRFISAATTSSVWIFSLGAAGAGQGQWFGSQCQGAHGDGSCLGLFHILLVNRGGKNELLLESNRFPSFDTLPACGERVREVKNADAGPLLLWLER